MRAFGGIKTWGVALGGDALKHCSRVIRHGTQHNRHLRLDDAAFLGRNLGNRVSEPVAVVQTDAGDDADGGLLDDIRRVKPPAQPGFKDEVINLFPRIEFKCRRRQKLEVGEFRV